jgi:starch synthase
MEAPLRIALFASEAAPWAKTGGLADVVGALANAFASRGHDVHLVLPLYGTINRELYSVRPVGLQVSTGLPGRWEPFEVFRAGREGPGLPQVWMLGHPLFNRAGLYGDQGGEFGDNHLRFAGFCKAALDLARQRFGPPDIVHLHDWQTALAAVDLRAPGVQVDPAFAATRVVFTIHNLAYAGSFPAEALEEIGLPRRLYSSEALEFYGRLALVKGGLVFADRLTTVSPRYAQEIQTPEFGNGFDGLLRTRSNELSGILNGIDEHTWNPATDPALPARYDVDHLEGKAVCKEALQKELELRVDPRAPLFGVVSRLAWQKGIDLVAELGDSICRMGGQLAVLGTGEPGLEGWLSELRKRLPGACAVGIQFDEALAHRMVAGSDAFLMPSRYEPCGLTQMYALRYGTVPIVRSVGGLDDTVEELDSARAEGTGFKFGAATASAFWAAIQRALSAWEQQEVWTELARRGMVKNFSWDTSAAAYETLFRESRRNQGAAAST